MKYICVLDFESTCDGSKGFDNEIIEFPSILLKWNGTNYEKISQFQQFCKPLVNHTVSDFCHNLTGISQHQVNNGNNFIDVLNDHYNWINTHTNDDVVFLTCGYWDLGIMMPKECKKWNIIPPKIYLNVINIKDEFKKFYSVSESYGMAWMLENLKMDLIGKHHSGIDDCNNITRILQRMISDGYDINNANTINIDLIEKYTIKHYNRKDYKLYANLLSERLTKK
jgi:inhibitor of KinA sporulation pathway (predicted exonuclease)